MFEEPAEFLLTLDASATKRNGGGHLARGIRQWTIVPSPVRPMLGVKDFEPFDDVTQMIDAETDKVVQTFPANRLHQSLSERMQIGLSRSDADDLQAITLQSRTEPCCELRVHVQDGYFGAAACSANTIDTLRACGTIHASSGFVAIPAM